MGAAVMNQKSSRDPGPAGPQAVLRWRDSSKAELISLLARGQIKVHEVAPGADIPGSYWGAPEAGLIENRLYLRADTPVHSALHEACHYFCMAPERRAGLHTDAGGDYDEENAVCYLQILLAGRLADVGQRRILSDMDRWGYSFRLGSAEAWFRQDADDARAWLLQRGLINEEGDILWKAF